MRFSYLPGLLICIPAIVPGSAVNGQVISASARPPAEINRSQIAAGQGPAVIVGATLIDGRGGPPVPDSVVIVQDDTIVQVGRRAQVSVPRDAEILDASGMFLLPGLIDSHFHARDNPQPLVNFELHNGVTSLRDPGHPFKYYTKILQADSPLPRIFLCGGHLDGRPPVWPDQAVVVLTPADVRQAVTRHVEAGASAIKIYFRVPAEFIEVACQQADELRVPVTAHLELVDADKAIRAGVDGIEHITSFGTALAEPEHARQFRQMVERDSSARKEWRYKLWSRIDPHSPRAEQLIDFIIRKEVFISPTLAVFEAKVGDDGNDEKAVAFSNMLQFLGNCHQAGARIVVGSHTSAPYAPRGKAYRRELELLVKAGLSPMAAILAATSTNARFLGSADRLGTVEAGKLADLLLVGSDPMEQIAHLDDVRHVMLNGRWVHRNP